MLLHCWVVAGVGLQMQLHSPCPLLSCRPHPRPPCCGPPFIHNGQLPLPPADAAKSAVESETGAAAAAAAAVAAAEAEEAAVEGMDEDEAAEILSAMLGLAPPSGKKGKKKVGGLGRCGWQVVLQRCRCGTFEVGHGMGETREEDPGTWHTPSRPAARPHELHPSLHRSQRPPMQQQQQQQRQQQAHGRRLPLARSVAAGMQLTGWCPAPAAPRGGTPSAWLRLWRRALPGSGSAPTAAPKVRWPAFFTARARGYGSPGRLLGLAPAAGSALRRLPCPCPGEG